MQNKVKEMLSILAIVVAIVIISSCTKNDPTSDYTPPADHTVSQNGFMHKPGFDTPLTNCTTCHGADLTGGTTGVSCYECHGKEW
jgi:cytochrome c553